VVDLGRVELPTNGLGNQVTVLTNARNFGLIDIHPQVPIRTLPWRPIELLMFCGIRTNCRSRLRDVHQIGDLVNHNNKKSLAVAGRLNH